MAGYSLSKNLPFNKHGDYSPIVFFKNILLKTSFHAPYIIQALSGNSLLLRHWRFFTKKARTSYLAMLGGHYTKEKNILLYRQKNASKKLVWEKEREEDVVKINFHPNNVGLIKKYDGCFSHGIHHSFNTLSSQLLAFTVLEWYTFRCTQIIFAFSFQNITLKSNNKSQLTGWMTSNY